LILALCLLLAAPAPPSSQSVLLSAYREARFSPSEIVEVEKGDLVAKMVETDDRSEVVTASAVRVKAAPEAVLAWLRGVDQWGRQPWIVQAGRVGRPASPRDFQGMTLDPGDVRDLPRCRVGKCEVRLPRDAIEQFGSRVDWTSPGAPEAANRLAREILAAYAARYLSTGNAALFEYVNNDDPVHIAAGFARILARSSFVEETTPDLAAYLASYPNGRPSDAEDFAYWMLEKFWRKTVLSLNHRTVVDRRGPGARVIVATTKQLYATHYYEASLSTTVFVEHPQGSYLITINRTRADIRPGGFTMIERFLINRLVPRRVENEMRALEQVLEGGPGAK
jgi:hypothetical protein